MTTLETKKIKQVNKYNVVDSRGRNTEIYYVASNIKDAAKMFKNDTENFRKFYYGKLVRGYNGGVRG
jgi:hypothetical protein